MKKVLPLYVEELLFLSILCFLWRICYRRVTPISVLLAAMLAVGIGIAVAWLIRRRFRYQQTRGIIYWLIEIGLIFVLTLIFTASFYCLAIAVGETPSVISLLTLGLLYAFAYYIADWMLESMIPEILRMFIAESTPNRDDK